MRSNLYHVPDRVTLSATWNYTSGDSRGPKAAIKGHDDAVYIKNRFGQTVSIPWKNVKAILNNRVKLRVMYASLGHDEKTIDNYFDDLTRMDIELQGEMMRQK